MKYLREDSEDNRLLLLFIRGIIDRRLISNPIHILTHLYDEVAKIVPIISVEENIIL